MKYLIIVMSVIMMSGCFYQSADITDILKAQQYCEYRGGVKHISIHAIGAESVRCLNGDFSSIHAITLNEYKVGDE